VTAPNRGAALPFDVARAHALFQALFGQIEDLIKDKQLLIVPSGPLPALPFSVLVIIVCVGLYRTSTLPCALSPREVCQLQTRSALRPPVEAGRFT
jgi:hypothetical protein